MCLYLYLHNALPLISSKPRGGYVRFKPGLGFYTGGNCASRLPSVPTCCASPENGNSNSRVQMTLADPRVRYPLSLASHLPFGPFQHLADYSSQSSWRRGKGAAGRGFRPGSSCAGRERRGVSFGRASEERSDACWVPLEPRSVSSAGFFAFLLPRGWEGPPAVGTMNLERVSNEEKLNLCRKYYLGEPLLAGPAQPDWGLGERCGLGETPQPLECSPRSPQGARGGDRIGVSRQGVRRKWVSGSPAGQL